MNANISFCEKEAAVIEAVRRGVWDGDLRAHASDCQACSDAVLAAETLRTMQASDLVDAQVPSAGWMWWRMQLRAKREAAERVTQPITLIQQATYACIALSAIGLAVWNWRAIATWFGLLGGVSHSASLSIHGAIQGFFVSVWERLGVLSLLGAGGLVLFCSVVAYFIFAEE
jgi:hypothetical protein